MISDKLKQLEEEINFDVWPNFNGMTLNIEIAGGCNEKCIYCEYSLRGIHKSSCFIDEKLFYRVTKEAKQLGIKDVGLYITAEPFLNPKIYDYVSYLKKELEFEYVYISTNGILCTPDNLEKIVSSGIDSIKFSVSGATKESFQKHHGVDAFEKVLDNIKYAYEFREKNNLDYKLYIFSIITKYNQKEKEEINNLYSPYVDEIIFSDVLPSPYTKGIKEKLLPDKIENSLAGGVDGGSIPCKQLFNRIVINEKGYLCACCHETRSGYTYIEDLNNMSLKEAVYGKKMQEIRKRHINNNISGTICENCVKCENKEVLPLNSKYIKKVEKINTVDITDEIIKRFNIKEK